MAGFINELFSIGASGTIPDVGTYNVVYTQSPSGTVSPTLVASTQAGGATTIYPSSYASMGTLLLLLLAVVAVIWIVK